MTDPITAITAGSIINLAFQEFAKVGGGELAKKSLGGAIDLAKTLRDKIFAKFRGNAKAENAITTVETNAAPEVVSTGLKKLEVYLEDLMSDDDDFAKEIRQIAHQIVNIQKQSTTNQENINYGRDQIIINQAGNINRIGGS